MCKRRRTFTLIEILVAAAILGIGIAIMGAIMVNLKQLEKRATYYYTAMNLARVPLEFAEATQWQNMDASSTSELGFDGARWSVIAGRWLAPYKFMRHIINQDYIDYTRDPEGYRLKILPRDDPESLRIRFEWQLNRPVTCRYSGGTARANLNFFDTVVTWKDKRDRRKGLTLGIIPFKHYNEFSMSINDFYWR